jgi:hypothetical protein
MRRVSWLVSIACGVLALSAIPAGPGCGLLTSVAWGQNFGQRTVSGAVLDANEQPVVGATVFLKNERTKAIRSYISTDKGHYHFAQVEMNIDFDLWAEKDGKKSATKTVSSWDDRKDFVSDLKIK